MRDLNYNHLRYFWAVAHEGSLTRAAERMNLSQSALSVQIQKLEHQIGHPLFERVGRKLILTEAGQIALDYADTVFKAGDELMSTLRGRPLATRQVLRVGALTTLSRNFQLEFLRPAGRPLGCRTDRPLRQHSRSARAIGGARHRRGPGQQRRAARRALVLAQSFAQRAARQPGRPSACRWAQVQISRRISRSEPILLPSLDSDIRVAFDRVLELAGIRPIILAEVDDMAMLRLLAREREGVTLVPPIVVRDELGGGCPRRALPDTRGHGDVLRHRAEAAVPQSAAERASPGREALGEGATTAGP